jgi:hypothetical protein
MEALEQINFQMSKLQFKLNQLADLFTTNDGQQVNKNMREVLHKCEQFAQDAGLEFFESSNTVRLSKEFQRAGGNGGAATTAKKQSVVPEMLAPDETAQLIANVVQKIGLSP